MSLKYTIFFNKTCELNGNRGVHYAQPDFLNLMMYILIEILLSFKIKFNIFVWEIHILF